MWLNDLPGLKWLYPGMKIKRWLFLAIFGTVVMAAGLAAFFPVRPQAALFSLALVFGGLTLAVIGLWRLTGSLVGALRPGQEREDLAKAVFLRRRQERGPRVVGIGGGTGMATLLRGLKLHTDHLAAIVTVADDGGSSGRLRAEMGVLPPGDVRMCLVALADTEPLMERLFQYRFRQAGEGLSGHNFGNLFIAALTAITGDFEEAIKESSKVLAVRGQVLPSTLADVVLQAELTDGRVIAGESEITRARGHIRRVFLTPRTPPALPEALGALAAADVIVLGPGSLYTSVLPNLLVEGVAEAIRHSPAVKIYVCNVMTQPGETDGYTVSDHVKAIVDHAGAGLIDYVLVNTRPVPPHLLRKYQEQGAAPVVFDADRLAQMGVTAVTADLASLTDLVRHEPERLAQAILALLGPKWKGFRRGRILAGGGGLAGAEERKT
ncbi:MAG: gluconeogenesis factor YvcK family protein [Betaproteobacteria bacterium]